MADARPSTPPFNPRTTRSSTALTPEQVRRIEENRLKAKARRAQHEAANATAATSSSTVPHRTPSGFPTGQKRPYAAVSSTTRSDAANQRDARAGPADTASTSSDIQAARKFTKFVEYDFSKMTDTKGGFLTSDDDPHNRALQAPSRPDGAAEKPAHMTLREWERHRLLRKLRDQRSGPFEPGLSVLAGPSPSAPQGCRECGSLEVDFRWLEIFGCRVCNACKEKFADRYSLLTKTEARDDYLLTDPELKDEELFRRMERPNPHKSNWQPMQLFLRYQVEEYAFSEAKWGSGEALDAEFERREKEKKARKEKKFREKLADLKKRTRVEAYKRRKDGVGEGGGFGDAIRSRGDRHEHEWGRAVVSKEGVMVKSCVECGMQVEELEL